MAFVTRIDSEDMQAEKSGIEVIENLGQMDGLDSIEDTKPGAFVWLCAAATAIGGMLFGCNYDVRIEFGRRFLTPSQTIRVSYQAFSSYSVMILAAGRSQTLRRKR
jgi:hypothetical protein